MKRNTTRSCGEESPGRSKMEWVRLGKYFFVFLGGGLAYIYIAWNDTSFKGKGLGRVQDQIISTLFQQIIIVDQ